jgi:hypothetical protein
MANQKEPAQVEKDTAVITTASIPEMECDWWIGVLPIGKTVVEADKEGDEWEGRLQEAVVYPAGGIHVKGISFTMDSFTLARDPNDLRIQSPRSHRRGNMQRLNGAKAREILGAMKNKVFRPMGAKKDKFEIHDVRGPAAFQGFGSNGQPTFAHTIPDKQPRDIPIAQYLYMVPLTGDWRAVRDAEKLPPSAAEMYPGEL